jgi:hypothetical protein
MVNHSRTHPPRTRTHTDPSLHLARRAPPRACAPGAGNCHPPRSHGQAVGLRFAGASRAIPAPGCTPRRWKTTPCARLSWRTSGQATPRICSLSCVHFDFRDRRAQPSTKRPTGTPPPHVYKHNTRPSFYRLNVVEAKPAEDTIDEDGFSLPAPTPAQVTHPSEQCSLPNSSVPFHKRAARSWRMWCRPSSSSTKPQRRSAHKPRARTRW